jgi:hypothetical protein
VSFRHRFFKENLCGKSNYKEIIMRVFIKYTSDKTGKSVTEELDLDIIPQPRVGDMVFAEGRPRQVSKREFHLLGAEASGPWWPGVDDDDTIVVVRLIG